MPENATTPVLTRARARRIKLELSDLLGPDYTRLFHDTYVSAHRDVDLRLRATVAMKRVAHAHHVSHHTAVRLWGGVAPDSPDVHVSMLTREQRCRRRGVAAHLAPPDALVQSHHGLRVSSPVQAFLDLAGAGTNLVDLVVAGDSLVKATSLTSEQLVVATTAWTGRNARLARRAAGLVREGVDSPMETRLRLLIVLAGLPEPRVNLIAWFEDGTWRWRFDLSYPDLKIAIEYDGRQHALDSHQWKRDLERREDLDQLGWRLIVVTSDGIFVQPERTLQRVRAVLQDRGVRVPRRFKIEWTRHFAAYD